MSTSFSSPEIQHFPLKNFTFTSGTTLPSPHLAYTVLNPSAPKTALIITCFRGLISTTPTYTHTTGALSNHRIIIVALFGNSESSSPSNTSDFPRTIDYRDCVNAQHELLTQHLKIASLDLIMGFSMGGQCTYYWCSMYPDFTAHAIILCSSARTSRHNYQFLEGPKTALENAVDYVEGDGKKLDRTSTTSTADDGKASRGLQAFGKAYSAWLTSAEWFERELWTEMGFKSMAEWDAQVTEIGYRGWHPDDLLAKLRMWQNGDITVCSSTPEKKVSLEEALARIKTRVLLVPCQTDQYFRSEASEREARYLPNAEVDVIPSVWGHIAGGGANPTDTEWIDQRISRFLSGK